MLTMCRRTENIYDIIVFIFHTMFLFLSFILSFFRASSIARELAGLADDLHGPDSILLLIATWCVSKVYFFLTSSSSTLVLLLFFSRLLLYTVSVCARCVTFE